MSPSGLSGKGARSDGGGGGGGGWKDTEEQLQVGRGSNVERLFGSDQGERIRGRARDR